MGLYVTRRRIGAPPACAIPKIDVKTAAATMVATMRRCVVKKLLSLRVVFQR